MIPASIPAARPLRIATLLLLAVFVAGILAAELVLPRVLEQRLRSAIESTEGWTGRLASVDVCSPCLSYTIRDIELRREGEEGEPLFEAPEVEVGLRPDTLVRLHPGGHIVARQPTLRIGVGKAQEGEASALDIPWARIGRTLLPVRLQRFQVHDGSLRLAHRGMEPPVHWHFRGVEIRGWHLAADDGEAAEIRARGATPGDGRFDVGVHFPADSFTLGGRIDGLALVAIHDYLQHVLGVDVEGGSLSASFSAQGSASGWAGVLDCRLKDVELLEAGELVRSPIQALQDAVAGGLVWTAEDERDVLHARLDFGEQVGEVQFGTWGVLGRLARRALLAPFGMPASLLGVGGASAEDGS